jgi:hypothetical protein
MGSDSIDFRGNADPNKNVIPAKTGIYYYRSQLNFRGLRLDGSRLGGRDDEGSEKSMESDPIDLLLVFLAVILDGCGNGIFCQDRTMDFYRW